jgi:hypothetical protein
MNSRLHEFVHTLIADAIRWTPGCLDEQKKQTLIKVITMAYKSNLTEEDFMEVRHALEDGGFNVSPLLQDD